MGWAWALDKAQGIHHDWISCTRGTSFDDAIMEKIMDEWGEGMEDTLIWGCGFFVGFLVGVIRGRRSIVREAQALVSEAIMEIRKGYKVWTIP